MASAFFNDESFKIDNLLVLNPESNRIEENLMEQLCGKHVVHTFWKPKACQKSLKTRPKRYCYREKGFENPAPSIDALCVSKCLALSEGLMREQTDVSLKM